LPANPRREQASMKTKRYNRVRLLRVCIQSLALIFFIYACLEF
jgi:hypothetical protein